MGIDLNTIMTPQVTTALRLLVIIFALVELGSALILFRQVNRVNQIVRTPNAGCVNMLTLVHVLLVLGILILVILY